MKKKQKSDNIIKKDIKQLLNDQTKVILGAVDKKLEANQDAMATMVFNDVQGTQDLLVGKIDKIGADITIMHKEIKKINLNLVDAVRKEDFDKLADRVDVVEEVLELKLKKA